MNPTTATATIGTTPHDADRSIAAGNDVTRVPVDCRLLVFAATCMFVGITWDISWHQTIGRDTFWTPAHMVIYVGGALAGLCGGWRVLGLTFSPNPAARAGAVRIWGLYGPIGAWVAIWGSLAMLISAPFDDWWHNAYGLDVTILSPPHSLLAAGMHHVVVGALLLVASLQNRSSAAGQKTGSGLFLYASGVMLALAAILLTEMSFPNHQRSAEFYLGSALLYPCLLVTIARASNRRWAATIAALIYMGLRLSMVWVLPRFEATPMLAPIYNPVTHMVPPTFPLLLVIPAVGIDLLFWLLGKESRWWRQALLVPLLSVVFLGLFFVTQWYFSAFLISPMADNWFFAGNRSWSYNIDVGEWGNRFWKLKSDPVTAQTLVRAQVYALISTTVGLVWGYWISRVKR